MLNKGDEMNYLYLAWGLLLIASLIIGGVGLARARSNWKWAMLPLVGAILMRAYVTAIYGLLEYQGAIMLLTWVTVGLAFVGTVGLAVFSYGSWRCWRTQAE